jgi:hypothetical protein
MKNSVSAHRSRLAHLASVAGPIAVTAFRPKKANSLLSAIRRQTSVRSTHGILQRAPEDRFYAGDCGWSAAMRKAVPEVFDNPRAVRSASQIPLSVRLAALTGQWTPEVIAASWDFALAPYGASAAPEHGDVPTDLAEVQAGTDKTNPITEGRSSTRGIARLWSSFLARRIP